MLLALDLDGTLLTTDKRLTQRNIEAITRAQDAGTTVVLASGRHPYSMARYADALHLRKRGGYVLAFNGAQLYDYPTGQLLFQQHLPLHILPRLRDWARRYSLPMLSFRGPIEAPTIISEMPEDHYVVENAANNLMNVEGVDDIAEALAALPTPPPKCLLPGPPELLPEVEAAMKADLAGEIAIYRSAPHYLELVPLGVDKGQTLLRLKAHLGLNQTNLPIPSLTKATVPDASALAPIVPGASTPGSTLPGTSAQEASIAPALIACGDQDNDIPMLRVADIGVAMGNAAANVKAAADFVTLHCDNDGVAHAIDHLILNTK